MNAKPTDGVVMMGMGYIGLPTAALMAGKKLSVTGVDVNQSVVDTIGRGDIHIVEPDLAGLVRHVVETGYLKAATSPVEAEVFLIAVPTPFSDGYKPDLTFVEKAVRAIAPKLKAGNLVIIESTSPVGTTEKMKIIIDKLRPELQHKLHMAYCPERVLPGRILFELENNDRVIGGINEASTQKATDFYRQFVKGELHATNARTAEMCKLVENASRDVQIAFANELSIISDKAGINVWELIRLANRHPRVNILQPGTGVGGHCIAVDPWFIVNDFSEEARLIRDAREINNFKTEWVLEKIKNAALTFKIDHKRNAKIACMGLAFKPDIDDLRESPALWVTESLVKSNFEVLPVEPNLDAHDTLPLYDTDAAVEQADIIVFLVNHKRFKGSITDGKIVLDFCGFNK